MVAIWMGTSAFNMPSCIRPVSVRYCETSKSKLRHWRSPLALASIGTAPISVAMWVSCELRRRSPRSCSLELACRDRPEGNVPHVSTLCSESELFDTALENCRAQTGCSRCLRRRAARGVNPPSQRGYRVHPASFSAGLGSGGSASVSGFRRF
jgi:hypothetical protein